MKMNLLKLLAILLAGYFVLTAESCDDPTTQQQEASRQDASLAQSNAAVPFPSTPNWTEKRQLALIIEKRDTPHLQTYTYLVSEMTMAHSPLCRSEGYGHPETEQFTNPLVPVEHGADGITAIAQPDPNGLYSSPSSNGTWVLCAFKDGTVEPVRSEPDVITLPEPWDKLNQEGM